MKVKYQQLYSNECGICSLNNLLYLYKIKPTSNLTLDKKGTNIYELKKNLEKHFSLVRIIKCNINEFQKIKKINPFISILKIDNCLHYVVIYKKRKNNFYILDSLYKKSYKLTLNQLKNYSYNIHIIGENL